MEDVVNDSLKVERVVGVLHDVVVVGPFQLEWMRKDVSTFRTTHFAETVLVSHVLEVRVVQRDKTLLDVFQGTGIRK